MRAPFRIFINYRREDSRPYAQLIYRSLVGNWQGDDQVFLDVDRIGAGLDFADAIRHAVGRCDVVVTVIGKDWLSATNPVTGLRRLDEPEDYVRLELEAALARDIRIIPLLVGGAPMPAQGDLPPTLERLSRRNAIELSDSHWDYDLDRLIRVLGDIEREAIGSDAVPVSPPAQRAEEAPEKPRIPRRPHTRAWPKRRMLVAGSALAAAIAGAVVAALLLTGGGKKMPPHEADAITSELLLAHVPEEISGTCAKAGIEQEHKAIFLRRVQCSVPGGGSVVFSRAHSGQALKEQFDEHLRNDAGVTHFPTGSCKNDAAAGEPWVRVELGGHREERSSSAEGRVLCYERDGIAYIEWTDGPTKIFGQLSAPSQDRQRIYSFLATSAGPVKKRAEMMPHDMTTDYPDSIDQELLLAHLPRADRAGCHRPEEGLDQTIFLRTIACKQGASDETVTYGYAHAGTVLVDYARGRPGEIGLNASAGGSCARGDAVAKYWLARGNHKIETDRPRPSSGRLICWTSGGRANLEWSDNSRLIYATASRPESEMHELITWWEDEAGPIGDTKHKPEMDSTPAAGTSTGMSAEHDDTMNG